MIYDYYYCCNYCFDIVANMKNLRDAVQRGLIFISCHNTCYKICLQNKIGVHKNIEHIKLQSNLGEK